MSICKQRSVNFIFVILCMLSTITYLLIIGSHAITETIPLKEYAQRIKHFQARIDRQFPVQTNNILNFDAREVHHHMQQSYPLLHGSVLSLIHNFLLVKKIYGSHVERKLYTNMTIVQFVDRLATKKAVVFFGESDVYLLRNGRQSSGKWEYIGTDMEGNVSVNAPKLKDYLSYDELMISALCGISSPTHFINNGNRDNRGKMPTENKNKYPFEGIYIGLVGARFEKKNYMEYSLMIIDKEQNIKANSYGIYSKKMNKLTLDNALDEQLLFAKISESSEYINNRIIWRVFEQFFNKSYLPTYDELKNKYDKQKIDNNYIKKSLYYSEKIQYLDLKMFKQRIRISLELFYFDADRRAKIREWTPKTNNNELHGAYCYVIGLGTGVWSFLTAQQNQLIVEVSKEIISETNLQNIDVIYFGWIDYRNIFDTDENGNYFVSDKFGHKISIFSGRNNPAEILKEPYDECLLIVMYAWDSNAFPGNEYYFGDLSASGDPAAASCSTISFVQNSEINKEFITGENTAIYFFDQATNQYKFYKLRDIDFENNRKKWLKQSILSTPYVRERLLSTIGHIRQSDHANSSDEQLKTI
eukprot:103578_1